MMKNKILLLALIGSIAFVSCKKDDDSNNDGGNNTPLTTQQKITGSWDGDAVLLHYYINGTKIDSLTDVYDISTETFDFNSDGNLYVYDNGTLFVTYAWSVINNNTISIQGTDFSIHKLSTTEFDYSSLTSVTDSATGDVITVENYFELKK